MEIGFVGLGRMGFHMVRRLMDAGHALTVFDTRTEAVERAAALGAAQARSAREVADRAETVMVSLPSPQAVMDVAAGDDGVAGGAKVRRFVDLSTTGARMAIRVAERLSARGLAHIDSPVSGGPAGAEKGTLAVMVSGPAAEIAQVRPALEVFGEVFVVGERPGMAQTMKLANNLLSATALAATSEAIVMGARAGLDPAVMIEVINAGSGRNSASQDKFPRAILPRTFDYGFTSGLMKKDLELCLEEAAAGGAPMRVGAVIGALFRETVARYGEDADFTRVAQLVEEQAGRRNP